MESLKAAAQRLADETANKVLMHPFQSGPKIIQSAILEGMKLAMEEAAKVCDLHASRLIDGPAKTHVEVVASLIRAMKGETHD